MTYLWARRVLASRAAQYTLLNPNVGMCMPWRGSVTTVVLLSVLWAATCSGANPCARAPHTARDGRASGASDVWTCDQLLQKDVGRAGSGIVWRRLRCANPGTPVGAIGPMVFNTVTVNLTAPGVRVTGGRATPPGEQGSDGLQPLQQMALNVPGAVAGINGGYFYRTDTSSFVDFVCRGKTLADAKQPPSPAHPNDGIGDGILIINGSSVSYNCDLPGYSVPVSLVIDGPQSYFQIQGRGGVLPATTRDALAAGPNLVSYNTSTRRPEVYIPPDDDNINILEHAANTAVGLYGPAPGSAGVLPTGGPFHSLVMVTANGHDGCSWLNATCGINAYGMAYFMRDAMNVTAAMEMDQGGSTTMFVKGQGNDGVVSCSSIGSATCPPRDLFGGLFVTLDA